MAITDWPEHERPRERLLAHGAGALADAELLAIFLRVGIKGKSAVELARDVLAHFGNDLGRLAAAPIKDIAVIPGMGPAKAVQMQAAFELARRALAQEMTQRDLLASPRAVKDWLRLKLASLEYEVFGAIWLDSQNRLIAWEELFRGTLNKAAVYPREVVKQALAHNAAAVLLCHNHPSGVSEPSDADKMLTQALKDALRLVDVRVLDHFIVAGNAEPLSFAERGLL